MKNFLAAVLIFALGGGAMWLWLSHENRPCIAEEKRIRREYAVYNSGSDGDEYLVKLVNAKMFANLAETGCPENKSANAAASERELNEAKKMMADRALLGAAITVDSQKVADAVGSAIEQASVAVGGLIEKMRGAKISIDVK
ncbi:MAG: hypothetical protein LBB08_01800 [Rickettsiales bacterium]|jgi:hypothetical protein|nr:hypothetical protein [Rickettsiales bacterium]